MKVITDGGKVMKCFAIGVGGSMTESRVVGIKVGYNEGWGIEVEEFDDFGGGNFDVGFFGMEWTVVGGEYYLSLFTESFNSKKIVIVKEVENFIFDSVSNKYSCPIIGTFWRID